MKNKSSSQKGLALIFALFLVASVFASLQLAFFSQINQQVLSKAYQNSLQVLYSAEAGRNACHWEMRHADIVNLWDTQSDVTHLKEVSFDPNHWYSLSGYKFRVKAFNDPSAGRTICYIHAFQGDLANPQYSKYLEAVYGSIPSYQFAYFSNGDLEFPDDSVLYLCNGGRIHSNKDIIFKPRGNRNDDTGLRFDQLGEMTASGTIKYGRNYMLGGYPDPKYIDLLDAYDLDGDGVLSWGEQNNTTFIDGRAPAPYAMVNMTSRHDYTTDGMNVSAGPYAMWYENTLQEKGSGFYWTTCGAEWLGGWFTRTGTTGGKWQAIGESTLLNNIPLIWRGEETMFGGRQYNGSRFDNDTYYENKILWLLKDGYYTTGYFFPERSATTYTFALSNDRSSLLTNVDTQGKYCPANVMFEPYKNSLGDLNNGTWFELPGSLPEGYPWTDKYAAGANGTAVKFYATQICNSSAGGDASCRRETHPGDPNATDGWRYIKKDPTNPSVYCANNTCYNSSTLYVPAEQYSYNGTLYFDYIRNLTGDRNEAFFASGYTYGTDLANPTTLIYAFNSESQKNAFLNQYLGYLSQQGFTGILNSGVPQKTFHAGKIFGSSSVYYQRAQDNGIYINATNKAAVMANLNSVPGFPDVARDVSFITWWNGQTINLLEININKMIQAGKAPANGLIYSQYPLRFCNATILPGTNSGGKTAVFTVLSEESIYLKGDYNNPPANSTDWKIANIGTKKVIYALSNNFIDPQTLLDFGVYHRYPSTGGNGPLYSWSPYIYVKKVGGNYIAQEGDPMVPDGKWIEGYYDDNKMLQTYGISNTTVTNWIRGLYNNRTANWTTFTATSRINRVDKNYTYNSFFITPYTVGHNVEPFIPGLGEQLALNYYLENWNNGSATCYLTQKGALINLYDPADPNKTDYWTNVSTTEGSFNDRRVPPGDTTHYPPSNWSIFNDGRSKPNLSFQYDRRYADASPLSFDAVLGLTGENSWRQITQEYFQAQTSP